MAETSWTHLLAPLPDLKPATFGATITIYFAPVPQEPFSVLHVVPEGALGKHWPVNISCQKGRSSSGDPHGSKSGVFLYSPVNIS